LLSPEIREGNYLELNDLRGDFIRHQKKRTGAIPFPKVVSGIARIQKYIP
jgi:hypothetical protein